MTQLTYSRVLEHGLHEVQLLVQLDFGIAQSYPAPSVELVDLVLADLAADLDGEIQLWLYRCYSWFPGSRALSSTKSYGSLTLSSASFCKINTIGNVHDGWFLRWGCSFFLTSVLREWLLQMLENWDASRELVCALLCACFHLLGWEGLSSLPFRWIELILLSRLWLLIAVISGAVDPPNAFWFWDSCAVGIASWSYCSTLKPVSWPATWVTVFCWFLVII